MREPEALSILEEIYRLEAGSFIRYLVEISRPPVFDDEDRQALALYQDLYRQVERNSEAVAELLTDEGVVPAPIRWPLPYTSYNFLRPRYLLRPLLERFEGQIGEVEAAARALSAHDWSEARETVEMMIEREKGCIERLRSAIATIPEESAEPPELKGTSASQW